MPTYITAAFRSSSENEAYLFMKDKYVRLNYTRDMRNSNTVLRPLKVSKTFPCLDLCQAFVDGGIDCAFGSHHGDEAFIFFKDRCAKISAPPTGKVRIICGPKPIVERFPFLEGSVFASGIDSAFEATARDEVYLFKGNRYARINYKVHGRVISNGRITERFGCLKNTTFRKGIQAAFASHRKNEAYLFKGRFYVRIRSDPGTSNYRISDRVKEILPYNWHCLRGILPRHQNSSMNVIIMLVLILSVTYLFSK